MIIRKDSKTYLIPEEYEDGLLQFEGDILHVQHIDFKNSKLYQLDIQPSRCVILSEPIDWKNIKHLYLNKKGAGISPR